MQTSPSPIKPPRIHCQVFEGETLGELADQKDELPEQVAIQVIGPL